MQTSLNLDQIERLKSRGHKLEGQCPACAEDGGDRHGNHLIILADGKFGCAAHPQDGPHRQRIFQLVGTKQERPFDKGAWMQTKQAERDTQQRQAALANAASHQRDAILRDYAWPLDEVWEASPVRPADNLADNWRDLVQLMPREGLVWIGSPYDSGEGNEAHFRIRDEWLKCASQPGERMAPVTFQRGPFRSQDAIAAAPFVCVEADAAIGRKPITEADKDANKAASAALIRWISQELKWTLRAIIATGNKSLHAWFDHPGPAAVEQLATIARSWGIDDGLLRNPTAPLRLPGAIHEKTHAPATLLFLNSNFQQ